MRGSIVPVRGRRMPENIGDLDLHADGNKNCGGDVKDRRGATPHEIKEARRKQ